MDAIDWGTVNWLYFGLLVAVVFLTSLIGAYLSFRRRGLGALISALLFAGVFIFWSYYPHHLPLPTSPLRVVAPPPAAAVPSPPPGPASPASSEKPANPVRDIPPR
jgi:hypothetical protein